MYKFDDDEDAWLNCHPEDLWIFDKLILSTKLGHICGPKGVDVPKSGNYIIRPCVNLMGMGRGAHIASLTKDTDKNIPLGTFWCEFFTGRHISVDYHKGQQVLCVEGFRSASDLTKWDMWRKTQDKIELPEILQNLKGDYEWINVEMIGDKIIEVHLRRNPDFIHHDKEYIIPAYDSRQLTGHIFVDFPEYNRLGYFVPE